MTHYMTIINKLNTTQYQHLKHWIERVNISYQNQIHITLEGNNVTFKCYYGSPRFFVDHMKHFGAGKHVWTNLEFTSRIPTSIG